VFLNQSLVLLMNVIPVLAILKLGVVKPPFLVMMETIVLMTVASPTLDANTILSFAMTMTYVQTMNVSLPAGVSTLQ